MIRFDYSVGIEFEDEIIEKIGTVTKNIRLALAAEDRFFGTDCVIDGVPVDVTLNYENKTYMRKLEKCVRHGIGEVYYGIRKSNGHIRFETPVLVIGFSVPFPVTRKNFRDTADIFKAEPAETVNTGLAEYRRECG